MVGKHFESRLAHVHGNLFALINIAVGLVLLRLPASRCVPCKSGLALLALAEVLLGAPPIWIMIGGISMVTVMAWAAAQIWQAETFH